MLEVANQGKKRLTSDWLPKIVYLRRLKIEITMRKLIIAAIVAACVSFLGEVRAEIMPVPASTTVAMEASKISPELADKIMMKVAIQTKRCYSSLCKMLDTGQVSIEQMGGNIYRVEIQENDGGVTILSVLDDF